MSWLRSGQGSTQKVERFEQYANEVTPKKGEPKHRDLVDRIAQLRRASLRALWTDAAEAFPEQGKAIWWEVWLRKQDGRELDRLLDFAEQLHLRIGQHRLAFDDRIVVLVHGTAEALSTSLDVLNDLAEVRLAKERATFFGDAPATEQAEWIRDLKRRLTMPPANAPAVCVLDTGVNRGHPLLEDLVSPEDATAVDPSWGGHDDGGGKGMAGHGTEMASALGRIDPPLLAKIDPPTLTTRSEVARCLRAA